MALAGSGVGDPVFMGGRWAVCGQCQLVFGSSAGGWAVADEKASANPIMVMGGREDRREVRTSSLAQRHGQGPGHGVAHQGHVERVEGVEAPRWDRGKHHLEVGTGNKL